MKPINRSASCALFLLAAAAAGAPTATQAAPVIFTLDETLSSITLTMFTGSTTSNSETLHLSGDFTLDLNPAASGSWDGGAALTDLFAGTIDGPAVLSLGTFITLRIDSVGLTGIDMTIPTLPATLTGGPGISSGTQYGVGTYYEVLGYAYTFLGNGPVDYADTAVSDWSLQVADAALLGIGGPGNVEALLSTSFTSLVQGTSGVYITADVTLAGTANVAPVPLPGALLLALSGLAGLWPFARRHR